MFDTPYIFSRLNDQSDAGAALAGLLADARAAGDNSDAFIFSFGDMLTKETSTQRTYLLAHDGRLVVGMVILVIDPAVTLPGVAQLKGIITRSAYRRKGLATQLLGMAGKLAAENDKRILTLETATGDHPAHFFKKTGFAINSNVPAFSSMADGRIIDTVIYWKRVDSA
ncbi:MAG: GNAT family N-acetyltransferase [Chitinophagaceae bacterium]